VPERQRRGDHARRDRRQRPRDPTALRSEVPDYLAADDGTLRGVRLGFDERYALDDVDAETRRAVETALATVRALGAEIVTVRFPDVADMLADWVLNCAVETAVAHAETFPAQRDRYGPGLAGLIDAGRALSGLDYQRILLRRRDFAGRVVAALDALDAMLLPAQPIAAPTVARMATLGQVPGQLAALTRFTAPFDMSGHPTLTLPVAFTTQGYRSVPSSSAGLSANRRSFASGARSSVRPIGTGATRRSSGAGRRMPWLLRPSVVPLPR
jgi:amidase